jgi:hypothetical protein
MIPQDDDDDLFNVTRKPKKVVKPLGDDDLFGDSGNIFADVPSKPKEKKKKKPAGATAASAGGKESFKRSIDPSHLLAARSCM